MFRSMLKTITCTAVMAISVAQAATVTDGSVNGNTNSGISGAGDSAAKIENHGMMSMPTVVAPIEVVPTVEMLSGPALMKQMLSGRLLVTRVPMAGMAKGRRSMRGLPADAFRSLHLLHGIKIGDLETGAGFAMPETSYDNVGKNIVTGWTGKSRGLKVHHGGKLLKSNDDWSLLDRGDKRFRGTGVNAFDRRIKGYEEDGQVAGGSNACASSAQGRDARLAVNKAQGLSEKLSEITSALFEEFAQIGRFLACLL